MSAGRVPTASASGVFSGGPTCLAQAEAGNWSLQRPDSSFACHPYRIVRDKAVIC